VNYDDTSWREHRNELFERVVHSGRARKRRRGFGAACVGLAIVLAVAAGVYLPNRGGRSLHVANNVPPETTVPTRTGVLLIGDEVMLGAKSALEHAIPEAHVDAAVSRQFDDAIPTIDAAKRLGALPPTIVIHLGTNGPSGPDAFDLVGAEFKTIMETVGTGSEVYFVSVKVPRPWEGEVNTALYSDVTGYPNAHVLAWHDFSGSHDDWFLNDGIHLSPAGQTAYAAFVVDGIRAPVATYRDPFGGGEIPATGFVVTDDAKPDGDHASFEMEIFDNAGHDLGSVPRTAVDTIASNAYQHLLVVSDSGIQFEPVPLDAPPDLPGGCIPTEKDHALAVALCGSGVGMNLLGNRILVRDGTGWRQIIGLPPVPAGSDLAGHWGWAAPSPDGRWVAGSWSAECEVPIGFLISVADGSVRTVTGEAGVAWRNAPTSGIIGWQEDGSAMGIFGGEDACGTPAPVQRGIYLVSPDTGARRLLMPLTPSQGILTWSDVTDQRDMKVAGDDPSITYAYGHFFDPALTADQRAALIEGSDQMRTFIDRSFTRHEGEAAAGAIVVDDITVHGATADVSFHALYHGLESPANPGQINGTAVLEDGTWKISRTTYCTLSANDGEPCPAGSGP
jgi:hypothetical protein